MDERLRELDRRFRAAGRVDDEVELVRERLRAGLLREERVMFCAQLGHPAARQVLGRVEPPPEVTIGYLDAALNFSTATWGWLERDDDLMLRLSIALASAATVLVRPPLARAAPLLDALARHAIAPSEATNAEVVVRSAGLMQWNPRDVDFQPTGTLAQHAEAALYWAADTVTVRADPQTGRSKAVDRTASCAISCEVVVSGLPHGEAQPRVQVRLRTAVLEQVAPWALGHDDPLVRRASRPV